MTVPHKGCENPSPSECARQSFWQATRFVGLKSAIKLAIPTSFMKTKALLFLSTASLLHAGSPDLETTIASKPEPWIKPVIDIRARYEYGDTEKLDSSNAFTVRERLR